MRRPADRNRPVAYPGTMPGSPCTPRASFPIRASSVRQLVLVNIVGSKVFIDRAVRRGIQKHLCVAGVVAIAGNRRRINCTARQRRYRAGLAADRACCRRTRQASSSSPLPSACGADDAVHRCRCPGGLFPKPDKAVQTIQRRVVEILDFLLGQIADSSLRFRDAPSPAVVQIADEHRAARIDPVAGQQLLQVADTQARSW